MVQEDLANKGPGRSLAQEIGDDARATLYSNKPEKWNFGGGAGDDFGYDFQVTAFGLGDTGAQRAFNIQLKGTTQAKARSADGLFLSYPFNRKTLNLWHKSNFAVLVAIADLIDTRDPKKAKIYFHFANPDLERTLPDLPPNQQTVTLHVPISQEIHRDLDILPIISPYLDEIRESRQLAQEKQRSSGRVTSETATTVAINDSSNISSGIGIFTDSIEDIINTSSLKIELNAALSALRAGDYDRVFRLIPYPLKNDSGQDSKDVGISAYLRARALDEIGDSSSADEMLNVAAAALPDNDDIVSLVAQKHFDKIELGPEGHEARLALLKTLESINGVAVTSLKAKIYALEDDFDIAREILEPFSPEKIATTLVIISITERSWRRALTEIENSRSLPGMMEKQLFWLDLLEAKAYLELALDGIDRPEGGEFIVPVSGMPGIDYKALQNAYKTSLKSMFAGQRLNWPASIQYMLDAFPISSMLLGYTNDALPLLASLGFARPSVKGIREVVAKFAVQFNQPQIAIELNDRKGDSEYFKHEQVVVAVAAYKIGHVTKALSYITDDLLEDPSLDGVFLSSLVTLGIAADSALRSDLLDKIRNRLDSDEFSRHYLVFMDSAIRVQHSPLQRQNEMRRLYEYWAAQGLPEIIGHHLLINSDSTNPEEAELIIDVANKIGVESSLDAEQLAKYCQALLTQSKYKDAIRCLLDSSERYNDEPRLKSLLGIAFEFDGQSAKAYDLIGQLLDSGEASETARRYYIQIATRMGFFDKAEEQVRSALAKTESHKKRLQHLNTLYQLLLAAGDRPKDVEKVAWEYGKLADQEDEGEEGLFLQEYLIATSSSDLDLGPERVQEFRERLETYNERFPKSKYLWRAEVPVDGPPEAMVKALQEAAGVTEQEIANGLSIERKLDRGALLIPFSWRPRKFLRNISDLFMLWQFRKQAPRERAAFHFQCNITGYTRLTPQDLTSKEIVISFTSILLLDEIGLLGKVLDSFPKIIIARSILANIQEARGLFSGGLGSKKALRIMKELQRCFSKISHPPYQINDTNLNIPGWHEEEKIAMEHTERVYLCDDIIETILVCGDGIKHPPKASMTVINFLEWADLSLGLLSAKQVAEILGLLIRLNVGVITIQDRYLIASIPDDLQSANTPVDEKNAIDNAQALRSILDGLWDPLKPFNELEMHFAQNMSYLLNEGNASEAVLVALWLRWLQTVRFQEKPPLLVIYKLVRGFLRILSFLKPEKLIVHKLWQSFWTAISRGLSEGIQEPEDIVGVRKVAEFLGTMRASENTAADAGRCFEKARLGLEQGTELDAKFNSIYIDSTAKKIKKQLASKQVGEAD